MSATPIKNRGGSAISDPPIVVPVLAESPGELHHLQHVDVPHDRGVGMITQVDRITRQAQHVPGSPTAHAPSRSAVTANRFRSRTVSCSVGSIPARATNEAPATGDMCALAVGLSVMLAAST
jgi:hypothetical protein